AGTGKSTLLAAAAQRAERDYPGAVVVTRYIGFTPETSSFTDLLGGLHREHAARFQQPLPDPITDLSQLVSAVSLQLRSLQITAERPLLVLVDALDQLSIEPQRTDWLPRALAPHVHVVVSVLADRQEVVDLRQWVPEDHVLTLGALAREAGREVLRHWLSQGRRTLTAAQEAPVLDAFVVEGHPLYLRMVAQEARRWRSFDTPPALPTTTTALLAAVLDRLEAPGHHGRT